MNQEQQNGLDAVLAKELAGVEAPPGLWERVLSPEHAHKKARVPPLAWALAAGGLIAASMWFMLTQEEPKVTTEIASNDSVQVRAWIRANSGLDVPLSSKPMPPARLTGARLLDDGRIAEIAYKIGETDAKLTVKRAPTSKTDHSALDNAAYSGKSVVSWAMRGQMYTLACTSAEELRIACRLCHV